MSKSKNDNAPDEGPEEQALRDGLKVNVLSPEALQRIREAAAQEWRTVVPAPAPVRRRAYRYAVAASIVALVAAGSWAYLDKGPATTSGSELGSLASVDAPGLFDMKRFAPDVVLPAGATLHGGQKLDARGNAIVTMQDGGNLRIARASVIEILGSDVVSISRGEIYVDIPPGSHAASAFRVLTSAGEFRHHGTQFAIMIADGATRLRVREGQVAWRAAAGVSTVHAGTEVSIDSQGKAIHRDIPTAGRNWAWTEAIAPEVLIENRPLLEFLQWFARETGRKLEIDAHAREQAGAILMHGSVSGLTVTEALSAVMATTTTLEYQLPEGVIRVSSSRASQSPRT